MAVKGRGPAGQDGSNSHQCGSHTHTGSVPASKPDGSHSPPNSLPWSPPPTGAPPPGGKAEAQGLFGTMAVAGVLVFAAILFASTANASPKLPGFQHRSLNRVSDEAVPLKEKEGGVGSGHLRQKFLLEPSEGCRGGQLYFLVIVHSAPSHFRFPTVKKFWAVTLCQYF